MLESEEMKTPTLRRSYLFSLQPSTTKLPYTDVKPLINKHLLANQQASWNQNVKNKLYSIQPVLGVWGPGFREWAWE